MNEVTPPKKPLLYYYSLALLGLMLFNFLAMPYLAQRRVQEVDYGTFMEMTEKQEIGGPGKPDPLYQPGRRPDL